MTPRAAASDAQEVPAAPLEPPRPIDVSEVTELLLGGRRTLSRAMVADLAGMSFSDARRFWHALGFPADDLDEASFTEADLLALFRLAELVREGRLPKPTALAMTRAVGRTADRLGSWQVTLLAEHLGQDPDVPGEAEFSDPVTAQRVAAQVIALADDLEPMLVYAWRRHLVDAVSRLLSDAARADDGDHSLVGVPRFVGFADLVSFASLVRRLSDSELAAAVQRFEAVASDIVTAHGGRVVKTVGDEVLYTTRTPVPGVAIGLDLIDAFATDAVLPEIRVGCAYGPVVSRLGDVFGTTVNRAARLTSIASAGAVLADSALANALVSQSGFRVRPIRRRTLRGVGVVTPHVVTRETTSSRLGRQP
ncbi:MAG: adenylate/guanylate cyclase domain-containing protein [Dermatophilaceae bacterium]